MEDAPAHEQQRRRPAASTLAATEARLAAIWAATNDGMALSDPDGVVLEANPAYLRLYGYSAEEVVGQPFVAIFPPELRDWALAEYRRTFHHAPHEARYESAVTRSDGTRLIVESRVTFLEEGGVRTAMLSTIRDITERTAMEQALRSSEARFRALVDLAPVGIFETDRAGLVTFVNAAYCRITGLSYAEAMGDRWMAALHPDDRGRIAAAWGRTVSEGAPYSIDIRYRRPDGTVSWTAVEGAALTDAEGRTTGYIGVVLDITERVQIEQSLRAERDRFAQLLQGLSDLGEAVVTGVGRHLDFVNDAFCRISGYSRDELLALPDLRSLKIPLLQLASEERLGRIQRGEDISAFEGGLRHKDGHEVPLEISTHIIEAGDERQFLSVMREIAERKAAEEALRRSEARLQASLAEKEVLLKEVHHRVKNNLQVIISLLRLQSQQLTDARAREQFRDTQNRVRAMALVHEQLYGTSDLAHISFAAYVRSLATSVLRSYTTQAGHISLALSIADDLALTIDLAAPLGLLLTELISNSVKYAFDDGRHGKIAVEARADEQSLILRVADDGIGLPPNLDLSSPGSLGLQLVRRLVAQLGGSLEMSLNGGVAFTIAIPLTLKEAPR